MMSIPLSDSVHSYASNRLFRDAGENEVLLGETPYRRPTRTFDNAFINYERPLTRGTQASNSALSTHRLLINIYEADGVFLPHAAYDGFWDDFQAFYSAENIAHGESIRHALENKAFSFLQNDVEVTGPWTADTVIEFFKSFLKDQAETRDAEANNSPVLAAILNSRDPERCAKHYLIQLAPDFLSEASAMARVAPGSYGDIQSAIFNILIDEYGASVHANKHSTLFENTLQSVGLSPDIHTYWQFYHSTSLCLTNYFHYITKNKRLFFRYIGALFYTEASLVNVTKKQSEMLRKVFGAGVNTKYFDEHHHIDQHHGEMALQRVIIPALERFGDQVASEILRGYLEFQFLEELADADLIAQFDFFERLENDRCNAEKFYHEITNGERNVSLETFVECAGERSTTHTHPDHRLLVIESGKMDFWPLAGDPLSLTAGDILFIPRHRLHGSVVTSDECVYHQPVAESETKELHQNPQSHEV
ncbi:Cupin 2 protein [Chromohalobacter israelensis DSM 3043]|uniref:Cupin 2 protein n=2 Tax=Chromohalobacter israelensis TaxID=141390 RepID=Q1QZK5_CHRI1|nr:Cupin 2 protein [Chromohalobacter salexigens DSM 3043]